jgi:2-phospho-L-lactate guanylyltransferase
VTFTAVLPVKELALAKSRLGPASPARSALALAMAQDVAVAAGLVCTVLVVTDDPLAASDIPATHIEPDRPRSGLTAAVVHGVAVALRRDPGTGVVVLAADLPALRPAALAAVLRALDRPEPPTPRTAGVVADAAGIGTVLLAAAAGTTLVPAFEGGSFAKHRAGGAVDLTGLADAGMRRDVDTVADLAAAVQLGVGAATAAALARYREVWRAAGLT